MGQMMIEFCRESKLKSFFILFGKRTKLVHQFEKMPPVVTFIFAKLARAEPAFPRECQPKNKPS
jgi:hypothetical protein